MNRSSREDGRQGDHAAPDDQLDRTDDHQQRDRTSESAPYTDSTARSPLALHHFSRGCAQRQLLPASEAERTSLQVGRGAARIRADHQVAPPSAVVARVHLESRIGGRGDPLINMRCMRHLQWSFFGSS